MIFTEFSFTPSEFILLNGDKFAPEAKNEEGHQLLCSDGVVDGNSLAKIIITASILVNEEENALKIEIKEKKNFLGRKKSQSVYLRAEGPAPNWSAYTLESAVLFISGQLFAVQGEYNVYNVVKSILIEDKKHPWQKIIETVEWGLASSNWLIPVEGEATAVFSTPFICPAKVRDLAFAQPIEPIRELLRAYKKNNPETWQLISDEIDQAFKDRKTA
jgi:hypothetical protein